MKKLLPASITALLSHMLLIGGAFLIAWPFLWMLRASLRSSGEIFGAVADPVTLFQALSDNYGRALFETPLPRFLLNGVIVSGGILFFQVLTTVTCAFALAKYEFHGSKLLFALVLFALAMPAQVPALPIFLALAEFRLLDSYFAMMAPFLTSAFAIFLFCQFIRSFPDDIIAAARLDGMTEIEIVGRLILPAMLPAIAAFSVFSVTFHWNDLYWPMIVIKSAELAPPTLGILFFKGQEGGDNFGALMASATLVTAPLILVFLAAQRQFIQGVTMTGVK